MAGAGYEQYEVANFAKTEALRSRHNMMYWEGDRPYAAFGMGATSYTDGERVRRPSTLGGYFRFIQSGEGAEIETQDTRMVLQAIVMCGLRTREGINYNQLRKYLSFDQIE